MHSVDEVRIDSTTTLLFPAFDFHNLHTYGLVYIYQMSGQIMFVSDATVSQREKQSLEKIRAMAYEAVYG